MTGTESPATPSLYPRNNFPIRRIGLSLLTAFLLLGCKETAPVTPKPNETAKPKTRVIFIGNSLTFSNNLPAIIQALAAAAGAEPFTYKMIAYGGYALEDHWDRQEPHTAIAEKTWDVVVLQQGASGSDAGRADLITYTKKFDEKIRSAGAATALYSVWPSKGYPGYSDYFDRISQSYSMAADTVDGMLFPVGEAWRAAWRRDSTIELYSPDQLHPSVEGSYLAALVIFQQLYDRSPIGLPSSIPLQAPLDGTVKVSPADAVILQQAAAEANATYRKR